MVRKTQPWWGLGLGRLDASRRKHTSSSCLNILSHSKGPKTKTWSIQYLVSILGIIIVVLGVYSVFGNFDPWGQRWPYPRDGLILPVRTAKPTGESSPGRARGSAAQGQPPALSLSWPLRLQKSRSVLVSLFCEYSHNHAIEHSVALRNYLPVALHRFGRLIGLRGRQKTRCQVLLPLPIKETALEKFSSHHSGCEMHQNVCPQSNDDASVKAS